MAETNARNVFVVHGRNRAARDAMFTFLRCLGLNPLEWSKIVQATQKANPYIGEVLNKGFEIAQVAVVLLTPDDEVRLKPEFWKDAEEEYEKTFRGQPRPNVIFEAGMAMGRYDDRTIIVELGKLRPMSDTIGRHVVRMSNDVPRRQELAQRIRSAGGAVDMDGLDWHTEGDFQAAVAGTLTPELQVNHQDAFIEGVKPAEISTPQADSPTAKDYVTLGEYLWYLSNPRIAHNESVVNSIRGFLELLDRCNLTSTRRVASVLAEAQYRYFLDSQLLTPESAANLEALMKAIRSSLELELESRGI